MLRIVPFAALAAFATMAQAEDRPLFRPTRDVTVEYHSNGAAPGPAPEASGTITMRFDSKTGRIRVEGSGGRGYAILDPASNTMTMVMPERQMYLERAGDPGMLPVFQSDNSQFRRTGTDTVAGLTCTTYDATINHRDGQVCLTGDGVLLRARSADPARRRELEAIKVTFGDQPAALFDLPTGYQKMDLSKPGGAGMPGAGMPGGPRPPAGTGGYPPAR